MSLAYGFAYGSLSSYIFPPSLRSTPLTSRCSKFMTGPGRHIRFLWSPCLVVYVVVVLVQLNSVLLHTRNFSISHRFGSYILIFESNRNHAQHAVLPCVIPRPRTVSLYASNPTSRLRQDILTDTGVWREERATEAQQTNRARLHCRDQW